ncbi:MAG: WYL domain-containing protein, partial [Oscillospiraceae bacterium]|nr:WYL domain-containing protein [Oscillospiraceae bacterium]
GRYYLICCKELYRTLSNYRIDRMTEMRIHDDFTRISLEELDAQTSYPHRLAEQLYMYSGEGEEVCFLADSRILSDVLDWFGSDIFIEPAENNQLCITVHVHPTAMQHWALQYGKYVTVLSPESLRSELAEIAADLAARYQREPEE